MRPVVGRSQTVRRSREPQEPKRIWRFALIGVMAVAGAAAGLMLVRPDLMTQGTERFAMFTGNVLAEAEGALGLSISDVTVSGRSKADPQELLQALGVQRGDAILEFDAEAARERLERVDWVESAQVQRLLPDVVHIDIAERKPFAIWQLNHEILLIDRDGRTITDEGLEPYAHLPFIVGHGAADHASEIISVVREEPDLASRITAYVRVGDRRWNLRFDNGIDLLLPEADEASAIHTMAQLDRQQHLLSRDVLAIDMRLKDRVSVRMSDEAIAALRDRHENGAKALIGGRMPAIHYGGSET